MTYILRLRKRKTHYPIKCATCKNEITYGQSYWAKSGGYEYHQDCPPPAKVKKHVFAQTTYKKHRGQLVPW